MNTTPQNQADAFFGGRTVTVVHEDGSTESVTARQLPLKHYKSALPLLDDEFALTAFCCDRTTEKGPAVADSNWVMTLRPKSFESLRAAVSEVNAEGFFVFATRHTEKQRRENEKLLQALDPERLKALSQAGASALQNSSPRPRLTPR